MDKQSYRLFLFLFSMSVAMNLYVIIRDHRKTKLEVKELEEKNGEN